MLETSLGRVCVCYTETTRDNSNSKIQSAMMTYKNILKLKNPSQYMVTLYLLGFVVFYEKYFIGITPSGITFAVCLCMCTVTGDSFETVETAKFPSCMRKVNKAIHKELKQILVTNRNSTDLE